jgi:hypothetical protein
MGYNVVLTVSGVPVATRWFVTRRKAERASVRGVRALTKTTKRPVAGKVLPA